MTSLIGQLALLLLMTFLSTAIYSSIKVLFGVAEDGIEQPGRRALYAGIAFGIVAAILMVGVVFTVYGLITLFRLIQALVLL